MKLLCQSRLLVLVTAFLAIVLTAFIVVVIPASARSTALDQAALITTKESAAANKWSEAFSHVELERDWVLDRNLLGVVLGRYLPGYAFAKWPDGHCSKQLFSYYQFFDGVNYSSRFSISGTGPQTTVSCDLVQVDEEALQQAISETAASRALLSLPQEHLDRLYQPIVQSFYPEYGYLASTRAIESADIVKSEGEKAGFQLAAYHQLAMIDTRGNCLSLQTKLVRDVEHLDSQVGQDLIQIWSDRKNVPWRATSEFRLKVLDGTPGQVPCSMIGADSLTQQAAIESIDFEIVPGEIGPEELRRLYYREVQKPIGFQLTLPLIKNDREIRRDFDELISEERYNFEIKSKDLDGECYRHKMASLTRHWDGKRMSYFHLNLGYSKRIACSEFEDTIDQSKLESVLREDGKEDPLGFLKPISTAAEALSENSEENPGAAEEEVPNGIGTSYEPLVGAVLFELITTDHPTVDWNHEVKTVKWQKDRLDSKTGHIKRRGVGMVAGTSADGKCHAIKYKAEEETSADGALLIERKIKYSGRVNKVKCW